MLSRDTQDVATLILAKHILIARAIDLDSTCDALSAMHEAPFDRIRPSADDGETLYRRFLALSTELTLLPPLLAELDLKIQEASAQLRRART